MFLIRRIWLHGELSEQTFQIAVLISPICYLSSLEVTAVLKLSLLIFFFSDLIKGNPNKIWLAFTGPSPSSAKLVREFVYQ